MEFSGILFILKPTRNRIYTAPAAQRLTLSSLNLPMSPSSTTRRELLSQFLTCSSKDDLQWVEIKENCYVLVNQFY